MSGTGQSLFDKLWQTHCIADLGGGTHLLHIDRIFLHERTGGVALQSLAESGHTVRHPELAFCTIDHIVDTLPGRNDQTLMPGGEAFIRITRQEALRSGMTLFDLGDPRQGIVHVVSPEQGIVLPGATVVCPDSHTCTQGALGALAWGIGSSEAEHALATQTLRVSKPKSMRVSFTGQLPQGVGAKDMALALIARFGAAGAKGAVVEFAGDAVSALGIEARMTLCNMAVEFSAFTAVIAPDASTLAYLKGRPFCPQGTHWDAAIEAWQSLNSDPDAHFDAELSLDVSTLAPMVTWGTSPQHAVAVTDAVPVTDANPVIGPEPLRSAVQQTSRSTGDASAQQAMHRALNYIGLTAGQMMAGVPISAAFIGSCTNSRLSDLRAAAAVLRGRHVAPGVRAICVPGSSQVKLAAEAEGLHEVFKQAGFEWRESGCSMCFFAGGESFGAQERVISTTNRNFESRQGPQTRTHLASPITVAASALAGCIADPRPYLSGCIADPRPYLSGCKTRPNESA